MPSPFPGMNPYIEQDDVWHDFHERFLPLVAELLVPQVRPNYIVKLDEHVYIHEASSDERRFLGRADLAVSHPNDIRSDSGTLATLAAPAYGSLPVAVDHERHSFVEIRDRRNRQLITVIELLSPSNKKSGPDREQYLLKRRELLSSPANLVEIDLLRGGPRLPVDGLPQCDYCVMVSRTEDRPKVGFWPVRLHDPLPRFPVPLRAADACAWIDLQQVVHRIHDSAAYADYIYSGFPQPLLNADDAEWALNLLKSQERAPDSR